MYGAPARCYRVVVRGIRGWPDDHRMSNKVFCLRLVRVATQPGKSITRVRVVTVPHSDYARWGLTVAPLNINAGEDIRWRPRHRHLADGIEFLADDYWLFDDNRVVFTPSLQTTVASRAAYKYPVRRLSSSKSYPSMRSTAKEPES